MDWEKSHWNYRILAKSVSNDVEFGLYEVYYEKNKPVSCSLSSVNIISFQSDEDPLKSILWELDAMRIATEKPILDYDDFPKEYDQRRKKLNYINNLLS